MHTTLRSAASRVNLVVGPMVLLIGLGAAVTAVILSIVMQTAWFLMLFIPAVLGIAGGLLILWLARRARLEIDAEGFRWCGFAGPERSVRWEELHQLLPPPAGRPRIVAVAQLRDGGQVEIEAVWQTTRALSAFYGSSDHRRAQDALRGAHQAWLAGRR